MTDATRTILRAALAADATLSAEERQGWEQAVRDGIGKTPAAAQAAALEPIVRHGELVRITGRSERSIRNVARSGRLVRVYCNGSRRSMGYTRASVLAWLGTRAPA